MTCISPGAAEYVTAVADKEKNKGSGNKNSISIHCSHFDLQRADKDSHCGQWLVLRLKGQ